MYKFRSDYPLANSLNDSTAIHGILPGGEITFDTSLSYSNALQVLQIEMVYLK